MIQISKNNSDLEKLFKSQKIIQISKNIQFSKNYSDLKKLFGSQKIIQISKYLKCKIKHTSPQGPSARPRQESWIGEH